MARNKLAFENTKLSKQEIVSLVVKKTRAWQAANQRKIAPTPRSTDSKLSLSTPMLAKTQCFVDEVWISATNMRGFEWLFKDPYQDLHDPCFQTANMSALCSSQKFLRWLHMLNIPIIGTKNTKGIYFFITVHGLCCDEDVFCYANVKT
ncbi:hypothetical protein YC2023_015918 [Brassica napus]